MKKTVTSILLVAAGAVSAFAADSTFDYTYANGALSDYGKGKKETLDVAMQIDNPSFAGMQLVGIKALINTTEGISNASLWLSSELTLKDGENAPDIASCSVTPEATTLDGRTYGLLQIDLPQPYQLTSDPVYVGYSITIDDTETNEEKRPIVISDDLNPEGFYFHASKSVLKWSDYVDKAGGVAYIVAVIKGEVATNSLAIKSYEEIFVEPSKGFNVAFTVVNSGASTITSLSYRYSYDEEGESGDGRIILQSPLAPSLTNDYIISLPFDGIETAGPHTLNVEITEINGEPNEDASSAITCQVNVVPFTPVHRPLVEEFTALWCGWCPRGFLAMEMLDALYGENAVVVCYHYEDEMAVMENFPVDVEGLPAATIERDGVIDPYYGSYGTEVEFGISQDFQAAMDSFTVAEISVNASLEGDVVKVESSSTFVKDYDDADFEVGYVLVENGLSNPVWIQSNDFSGRAGYAGTPLEVLTTWPPAVLGLVFNDVAVDVSGMTGVAGSIPQNLEMSKGYSHSYSISLQGNSLVQNQENLVAIAFLLDKSTGRVVNSNKSQVVTAGIGSISDKEEVVKTEFIDLQGRKVTDPGKGVYIKVETLSSGRIVAKKTLYTKP